MNLHGSAFVISGVSVLASPWDPTRRCVQFRHNSLTRRGLLQAGALGGFGLTLGDLLRSDAKATETSGKVAHRDKSVIILWMRGGPSHIDMWDPKPDAPAEIRGEFGTISTN